MSRRWILLLLLVSVIIRCIGLSRPLIDAHDIRQLHTAVLTKNLIEDGYPWLRTRGDWKGFENSTVVLELPVQMHLAARLSRVVGSIEAAGRLTAIAGWIAAFLLFAWLSRRLLSRFAADTALLIFAFSPLSIFFGQSFQPETWVLTLSLVVLCSFLRWCDDENPLWLVTMTAALMLGFTLKSNEMLHLAFPVAAVGWAKQGRRIVFRWPLWVVGAFAVGTLLAWSKVITHYNQESFPGWSSAGLLKAFLGSPADRFRPWFYAKLIGYMGLLGLTPVGVVFWLRGLWLQGMRQRDPLILGWGVGVAFYYLVFGPGGPAGHSYYHFVVLPWFCLVAAIGVESVIHSSAGWARSRLVRAGVVALWLGCAGFATAHLYGPDRVAWRAARALAELRPATDEAVLVASDHRSVTSGYTLYPTIFFYSGTRGYCLPAVERVETLDLLLWSRPEATWVIQTFPPASNHVSFRDRLPFFAHHALTQPPLDEPLLARGFTKMASTPEWAIFHRARPAVLR